MTFQLEPITWQSLSSITTTVAVATAVFWPLFRERRRLTVTTDVVHVGRRHDGDMQLSLRIDVWNLGRTPVVVSNARSTLNRSSSTATVCAMKTEDGHFLPATVGPKSRISLFWVTDLSVLRRRPEVFVEDITGKRWFSDMSQLVAVVQQIDRASVGEVSEN